MIVRSFLLLQRERLYLVDKNLLLLSSRSTTCVFSASLSPLAIPRFPPCQISFCSCVLLSSISSVYILWKSPSTLMVYCLERIVLLVVNNQCCASFSFMSNFCRSLTFIIKIQFETHSSTFERPSASLNSNKKHKVHNIPFLVGRLPLMSKIILTYL